MEPYSNTESNRDPKLWAIAKKRAGFKKDLATYFIVNAFLWLLWLLTLQNIDGNPVPWPVWPTAGWGVAMLIQYIEAYKYPKENLAEREYEKLKEQYK